MTKQFTDEQNREAVFNRLMAELRAKYPSKRSLYHHLKDNRKLNFRPS
jgi:hypothetical protein